MKSLSLLFKLVTVSFIFSVSLVSSSYVYAASGCCSWHGGVSYCDSRVGRYVCNDGTYSPTCGCYVAAPIVYTPKTPEMTANFTYSPNLDEKTFNVLMTWTNVPNTGFSIALHKLAGGNPGPLIDTTTNSWTFYNVLPGKYYADMKVGVNYIWSNIVYWEVNVPQWYSPVPPKPVAVTNNPITVVTPPSSVGDSITSTIIIVLIVGAGVVFVGYKMVKWLIQYAKGHDWVYTVLFWGVIIGAILIYSFISNTNKPETSNSTIPNTKSKYTCNCSKTCPNMSCEEAYFQLNTCGCTQRDGNNDGIPCEAQCK